MKTLACIPIAAALLLAPFAIAADHCHGDGCHAGPEPHVLVLAEFDLGDRHYYVVDDHGETQLWRESNGLDHGGQYYWMTGEAGPQSGLHVQGVCVHEGDVEYPEVAGGCEEDAVAVDADARVTSSMIFDELAGLLA